MKYHKSLLWILFPLIGIILVFTINYFLTIDFSIMITINSILGFIIGWNISIYHKFLTTKQ